jgi:hypothetical protein
MFFIFLSGYGLYISYNKRKYDNFRRVLKLYIHYWITLAIFLPIAEIIRGGYCESFSLLLKNIIAWDNTYNHETWFLLPYVLLAISSPLIFKWADKLRPQITFIITLLLYIAVRWCNRFDEPLLKQIKALFWIDNYLTLLFPFVLGCLSAKYMKISKMRSLLPLDKLSFASLMVMTSSFVAIILLRYHYQSIFYPFYVSMFILAFVMVRRPKVLDSFLAEMGRRSSSIWLIHTWFCYYLFQDFIYSFRYPLLIYLVLLAISYCCAVIVDWINRKMDSLIF